MMTVGSRSGYEERGRHVGATSISPYFIFDLTWSASYLHRHFPLSARQKKMPVKIIGIAADSRGGAHDRSVAGLYSGQSDVRFVVVSRCELDTHFFPAICMCMHSGTLLPC